MEFFKTVSSEKNGFSVTSNALLLCENAHNLQIFKKEKKSALDAHIKSLNAAFVKENKKEALAQLLVFLPQCSQETMAAEAVFWMKLCLQNMKATEDADFISASFVAITYILNRCHGNKEIFSSIPKLTSNFLNHVCATDIEDCEIPFECLFEFLRSFRLQALTHKARLEEKILKCVSLPLSAGSRRSVASAGKVFAALPVPGSAGCQEGKGRHLGQLLSLSHEALDSLFNGVQENEEYSYPRDHKLPLQILASARELNEPIRTLLTAASVAGNSLILIEQFLRHASSDFLRVCPKDLVQLAFRFLQVESSHLRASSSLECVALEFILPSLHSYALRFLRSLISANICDNFLNLVEEQVVATLKSTNQKRPLSKDEKVKNNLGKANSSVRSLCYETLAEVVTVAKCSHKGTLQELVPFLVQDILPARDSISLRSAKMRGGRLSLMVAKKKSKKKGYSIDPKDSNESGANIGGGGADAEGGDSQGVAVAVAALNLIEKLFLFASDSLSLGVVRSLTKPLTSLLQSRRHGVYANPEVRASHYAAACASASHPHPLCPPSYIILYHALEEGARDTHPLVSSTCTKGLSSLSFIMANPRVVTLADLSKLYSDNKESTKQSTENGENSSVGECSEEENDVNGNEEGNVNGNEEGNDVNGDEEENVDENEEESDLSEDENEDNDDHDENEKNDDHGKNVIDCISIDAGNDIENIEISSEEEKSEKEKETEWLNVSDSEDEICVIEVVKPDKKVHENEEEGEVSLASDKGNASLQMDHMKEEIKSAMKDAGSSTSLSEKKRKKTPKLRATKKTKVSQEQPKDGSDRNLLQDMLSSFVDADPDSD